MNHPKQKSGFTLVELLIVIAIISMLAGLTIPAVNMARERARRLTCANNLQNLSKALQEYERAKKFYPGWINKVGGKPASWPVTILKNIERADVYDVWREGNTNVEASKVHVSMFVCPSSGVQEDFPLSYVANCGQQDNQDKIVTSPSVPTIPPDWTANGVFFRHYCKDVANLFVTVKLASTDIADGLQYTLLLSENLQAGNWANIDPSSGDRLGCDNLERLNGMVWWLGGDTPASTVDDVKKYLQINANMDVERSDVMTGKFVGSYNYSRPSSNHPGGVNAVFCGGNSQFLNEQMDYKVYAQLMATDDDQVLYAGKTSTDENPATLLDLLEGKLSEDDFK